MARDNAARFTWSTVPNAWSSVTLNASAVHTATTPAVAPQNGTVVTFASIGGATGPATGTAIAINTTYYVVNSSGSSFGLATTLGGTALVLTGASSAIAMATVNLSPVSTTLGGRSAQIKIPASPSGHWSAAYSDALNVTRYRNTVADQSLLVSQTVTSGIAGDPPLQSSTSEGNYYLRASVGVAGVFGPSPCQLVLQGNGVNSTTAPIPGDFDWAPISTVGSCPANATQLNIITSGTTGGFTIRSGNAVAGQTFVPHTTAGGLTAGVQYLVGPSNTLYTTRGVALTGVTTATDVYGYVGSFTNYSAFTVATAANGSSSVLFDVLPQSGAAVVFTSITGGTGLSANTVYYVVASTTNGQVGLSATYGGTAIAVSTALTAGVGFITDLSRQPYMYVSDTTTGTFTCVSGLAGIQAAPHGLEVGDGVYLFSGSVAGTPALVTDQAYYVLTVPSATTFTLSATINGTAAVISGATNAVFAPARQFKIVNAQVDKTIRPWIRVAFTNQNNAYLQTGYATVMFADLAVGRDNSAVN